MKQCHFIGIGGIGMSGLARIMLSRNVAVTGSDISSSYVTENLVNVGAKVFIGHSAEHVTPQATVIYSTDIKKDNPEYLAALKLQCQMMHRSDLLLQLMEGYKTLAVAGTHGKTTTSALLAAVLVEGGIDPAFAVGGMIPQFQSNAGHGEGEYFVAEADESDGTFLKYHPHGAIITNIDLDHMNHFMTEEALIQSFKEFANKVASQQHLFWCGEDVRLRGLKLPGISYGFNPKCALRAFNWRQEGWNLVFDIDFQGKHYSDVEVALVGQHNILNALAVFGLALSIGVKEEAIRSALAAFGGVCRRCEKKGEEQEILILDDYAHHPTEISTTLNGIRQAIGERRLIAIFQPHRYTRTKDCLGTYGGIFEAADHLLITDIFGAGEIPISGLTYENVLAEIQQSSQMSCSYVPRNQLLTHLMSYLRPHDVVVTLGAGDITKLGGELASQLRQKEVNKIKVGVIFGGCSVEHEISLLSAPHVISGLRSEFYDTQHFCITKEGRWLCGEVAQAWLKEGPLEEPVSDDLLPHQVLQQLMACDVLLPVLHGSYGEDGTIQGFFEMLQKAYVGCDYRSAAIAMDKGLTKKLVMAHGIPTLPFISFSRHEWQQNSKAICHHVKEKMTFPVFVKPSHGGSSIGVHKVKQYEQLEKAIHDAMHFDTDLIVENGVEGPRELEFAVIGNDTVMVFPPGEICTNGQVYDYEAKYGKDGMRTNVVAKIPFEVQQEGMQLATRVYLSLGCKGMARVDFFLDEEGQLWFNELNPIPGFTNISLYPQICAAHGLGIAELVDRLIILALQRKRNQSRVKTGYEG